MFSVVRALERFHEDAGGLSTCWHFSFGHYFDRQNMGWSALRVFNDDILAPGGKFELHPHANFEIITVVLSGAIEHEDSAGHRGITAENEVQVMSAGRGVEHSEANAGGTPLKLLQIWIAPNQKGLEPSWTRHRFGETEYANRLCPLVSGRAGVKAPLSIHQDAAVYRSRLSARQTISHTGGSFNYLFVISGSLTLNGERMEIGDSARIKDEPMLRIRAGEEADFLLLDLPAFDG